MGWVCVRWVSMGMEKFPSATFGIGISPLPSIGWMDLTSVRKVALRSVRNEGKASKNKSNKKMEMGVVLVPRILGLGSAPPWNGSSGNSQSPSRRLGSGSQWDHGIMEWFGGKDLKAHPIP